MDVSYCYISISCCNDNAYISPVAVVGSGPLPAGAAAGAAEADEAADAAMTPPCDLPQTRSPTSYYLSFIAAIIST